MKVTLLASTPNALEVMCKAARTCYSEEPPVELKMTTDAQATLLDKVLGSGHMSVAEHVSFTFCIEDISRAASHQLVRHRLASYSQQSQRYVKYDNPSYYEPDSILHNREADAIFNQFLEYSTQAYNILLDLDIPAEDARYVLPNAMTSNMTMTVNLRELIAICNVRLCNRAQTEIRRIVREMAKVVIEVEPYFGKFLVPKCERDGFCTEEKCCGRKPKTVC